MYDSARAKLQPIALTALRVSVGIVMTVHGYMKLGDPAAWASNFQSMGIPAPEVSVYLAIAGEFFGGLGLIVGLLTPVAAFGVLCTMAVAIVGVHLPNGLLAQNGGFEFPLTLFMVALYFVTRGGGPYSVDALIRERMGRASKTGHAAQGESESAARA